MKSIAWIIVALVPLLGACATRPIGADLVNTREAYKQVEANVLSSGKLSSDTRSLLHRFDLTDLAARDPAKALIPLHERALLSNERSLLFALAELSYLAGEKTALGPKSSGARQPADYYLGAAVYAYLFLFGEGEDLPNPFDRRFRFACDLYNYGLGRALTDRAHPNSLVQISAGKRLLPLGEITLQVSVPDPSFKLDQYEHFRAADQYRVRGLSVRNRAPGLGAPLIAMGHIEQSLRIQRGSPATVFLRLPSLTLRALASEGQPAALELYSGYSSHEISIAGQSVPLEKDLTVARAYTLNQSFAWSSQKLQFFSPGAALPGQIILTEPYQPGKIPIVFVHGTFSSPVWWGEMLNTLYADPVVRERYQIWLYLYSSSKPLVISGDELRETLTETIQKVDPDGRDSSLQQMVVIGHSQGGILTKMTCTDSGEQLWQLFSEKSFNDLNLSESKREALQRYLFLKPLPFVSRVVFISTPHRGSYQAGGFVRRIIRRFVSLPTAVSQTTSDLLKTEGISAPEMLRIINPTSVDGMSPKNPLILALAEIPVVSHVKAHSIIPVKGEGDYETGKDGVVAYQSAHVDYVESELIVRGPHSCQEMPATIEEVRRILHEHVSAHP